MRAGGARVSVRGQSHGELVKDTLGYACRVAEVERACLPCIRSDDVMSQLHFW